MKRIVTWNRSSHIELNRSNQMIRRRTKFKNPIAVLVILIGLTGVWIEPATAAASTVTKEQGRRCKYQPLCRLKIDLFGVIRISADRFAKIKNRFQITKSCAPFQWPLPDTIAEMTTELMNPPVYLKSTHLKWEHSM